MVPLVVAVVLALWVVFAVARSHNRFVEERTTLTISWSNIDTELQRRHDLVPNLVDAVRGYAAHERATLDAVLRALEADHEFLLKGDVFTSDLIEAYIAYKFETEVDPMRMRPHPYEFSLYYDV